MSGMQSTLGNDDENRLEQKSADEIHEQQSPHSVNTDQHTSLAQSRSTRPRVKKNKQKFILPPTCTQRKTYDDVCRTPRMKFLVDKYLHGVNLETATCEQMTTRLTTWHKRSKRHLQQKTEAPNYHSNLAVSDMPDNTTIDVDIQATSSTTDKDGIESIKEELRHKFKANTVSEELMFSDLTTGRDKKEAATLLRTICELASADFIYVEQSGMCGNITIRKGSNFV